MSTTSNRDGSKANIPPRVTPLGTWQRTTLARCKPNDLVSLVPVTAGKVRIDASAIRRSETPRKGGTAAWLLVELAGPSTGNVNPDMRNINPTKENTDMSTMTVTPQPWPALVDLIRPQTQGENERLAASLAEHGQQHPVLVMPDGRIIDGYHRWMILGDNTQVRVADVTEEQGYALGITLNSARRQMTASDMKKVDKAYEDAIVALRDAGATQQEVARDLGLAQSTVSTTERKARQRQAAERGEEVTAAPDKRVKVNATQKRALLRAAQKGTSRAKLADKYGISVATVSKIINDDKRQQEDEAQGVTVRQRPSSVNLELADSARETGRRIYMAMVNSEQDPANVGAAVMRCVMNDADATQVVKVLRSAMTSEQWVSIVAAVAATIPAEAVAPVSDDNASSDDTTATTAAIQAEVQQLVANGVKVTAAQHKRIATKLSVPVALVKAVALDMDGSR